MNQRVPFFQRAIAHLKACLTLCLAVLFGLSSFAAPVWANQDIDAFTVTNLVSVGQTVNTTVADACSDSTLGVPTPCPNTPVTINFGSGFSRSLDSVVVNGETYVPDTGNLPGGLASRVIFQRSDVTIPLETINGRAVPGPTPNDGGRNILFYEFTPPAGSPYNVAPGIADSLEEGMLSRFINRGVDNIFNNLGINSTVATNIQDTRNSIERVDYIIDGGLTIPANSADQFGFVILDRGGQDSFGVAAITGLAGGNPSAYSPLRQNPVGAFAGATAATLESLVARDDALPPNGIAPIIRPAHAVGSQAVQGRFFSIADLLGNNPAVPTTIFGYSIFSGDTVSANPTAADLVDFTNTTFFPTDTDGNSDEGGLDLIAGGVVLTQVTTPQIGVAKTNSAPQPAGAPGFFNIDLTLRVTNTGNAVLSDVQLTEDLTAALINNAANRADAFTVQNVALDPSGVTGTAPTFNTAYDGTNTNPGTTDALFAPGNSFNVGDTAVVTITVNVDLGTNFGGPAPLDDGVLVATNQAVASGTAPNGDRTTDASQDGNDVDPDGDGNPGNNNDPTPLIIPFPSIGVAKSISSFRPVTGTTEFDFDFTITVTNEGATELTDVLLEEDLQDALITSATNRVDSFGVVSLSTVTSTGFGGGTPPNLNVGYDGVGDTQIFTAAPGNVFPIGATSTVVITVRADLGSGGAGPLNDGIVIAQNTATASGLPSGPNTPPGLARVTDESQNGTSVDPDGDGNPGNNNDPTPIIFPPTTTDLVLVKRITNIFRGGVALSVPGITAFNDDPSDANDASLNNALGGGNQLAGIFAQPAGFVLQTGDEVEYTVFFWNSSTGQISQVNLCDELQPPSVLNTAAGFQLAAVGPLGTPTFGAAGTTVQGRSPGAPLESFCLSAPGALSFPVGPPGPTGGLGVGAGGGVVAGAFTIPSNEFGAFRFRVRIAS